MSREYWIMISSSECIPTIASLVMKMTASAILALACLASVTPLSAAEPVKHIQIYVEPFYNSGAPGEVPRVGTGRPHAEMLASQRREDILAVRDRIVADPRVVTPMTMMVLAIRLYDVGLRDDAVFWFYVAKDRFRTLMEVATRNAAPLQTAATAMADFSALAGPVINGYAFCNIAKQQAARTKSIAWVEANPYAVIFNERVPARTPDRRAALADAIGLIKADAAKERAYFDDANRAAQFAADRRKNEADTRYCWK